ncbi:MAG: ribonuclease HII [Geminicoccaceae bacterium]|nr:ribonuclease HII [Geminicoccaceae bacterium]
MSEAAPPVAGVDEVGRGPRAGPVRAAAVRRRRPVPGLAYSTTRAPAEREELARALADSAWIALGAASLREIERLNVLEASLLAMRRAVARLPVRPALVLVDGNRDPRLGLPTRCIVRGDASEPAIAAASIVAKVVRDRLMAKLDARWPGYGFDRNAGYPTALHRAALRRLGPCPHHRRLFAPVAEALRAAPAPAPGPASISSPISSILPSELACEENSR